MFKSLGCSDSGFSGVSFRSGWDEFQRIFYVFAQHNQEKQTLEAYQVAKILVEQAEAVDAAILPPEEQERLRKDAAKAKLDAQVAFTKRSELGNVES